MPRALSAASGVGTLDYAPNQAPEHGHVTECRIAECQGQHTQAPAVGWPEDPSSGTAARHTWPPRSKGAAHEQKHHRAFRCPREGS